MLSIRISIFVFSELCGSALDKMMSISRSRAQGVARSSWRPTHRVPHSSPCMQPAVSFVSAKGGKCDSVRSARSLQCSAAPKPWSKKEGRLVLADGTVLSGRCFGASGVKVAEIVFNTSMSGYQEIMTDPSYRDQMVCFTHPHIGNVGINDGAKQHA